jgi:hypothetical protein
MHACTPGAAPTHVFMQALVDAGCQAGAVDDCLEELLPLMEAGLFSATAEQKAAAAYAAKHREVKAQKGFATYELLARLVSPDTQLEALLLPVRERLPGAAAPQLRGQLTLLLQHAARGLAANPRASLADACLFAFRQLRRSAAADAAQKALEASVEYAAAATPPQPPAEWQPHEELVTEFALAALLPRLRKARLDSGADADAMHARACVAPLLPKLADGVALRRTACARLCLKCLTAVAPAALPGTSSAADRAGRFVWKTLDNRQQLSLPLSQVRSHRACCYCA